MTEELDKMEFGINYELSCMELIHNYLPE